MQKSIADRRLPGESWSQTFVPAKRRHRTRLAHHLVQDTPNQKGEPALANPWQRRSTGLIEDAELTKRIRQQNLRRIRVTHSADYRSPLAEGVLS